MSKETKDIIGGICLITFFAVVSGIGGPDGDISIANVVLMIAAAMAMGIVQILPESHR